MEKYSFENLDIYQRSIDFTLNLRKICKKIKTDFEILDQIKRASLSVSLNLAEGSGRNHKRDKKNFYYFARGSLFECIPILTILRKEDLISMDEFNSIYSESQILAKMLTRLIHSLDDN